MGSKISPVPSGRLLDCGRRIHAWITRCRQPSRWDYRTGGLPAYPAVNCGARKNILCLRHGVPRTWDVRTRLCSRVARETSRDVAGVSSRAAGVTCPGAPGACAVMPDACVLRSPAMTEPASERNGHTSLKSCQSTAVGAARRLAHGAPGPPTDFATHTNPPTLNGSNRNGQKKLLRAGQPRSGDRG